MKARVAAGYATAADAARAFGWTKPTYFSHENGSRGIGVKTAAKYGKAFKVSGAWLLTGEGPPIPQPTINERKPQLVLYDRQLLIEAISGLLRRLLEMDENESTQFAKNVLGLVELRQGSTRGKNIPDTMSKAIEAQVDLFLPPKRE